jgi:hypothetical protein
MNHKMVFINGRHRTALLSKHIKSFPMALTRYDGSMAQIFGAFRWEMNESESFCIPDLLIK